MDPSKKRLMNKIFKSISILFLLMALYNAEGQVDNFVLNELMVEIPLDDKQKSEKDDIVKYFELLKQNYDVEEFEFIRNGLYVLQIDTSKQQVNDVIRKIKSIGVFINVEKNHFVYLFDSTNNSPNDEYYSEQWACHNDGSNWGAIYGADINIEAAWGITTGSEDITLAIIDTGLRMQHPDFQNRIWINSAELLDGIDNDNNGYVDDIYGWNFIYDDNNPSDDNGHGTHCAGICMATGNNEVGIAGVNWKSKLMVLKVLAESNYGEISDIVKAIYYAVDNGADVISLSLGTSSDNIFLKESIEYANNHGVIVVAAMGNGNTEDISYPAGYDNVVAVGATNWQDFRWYFPRYGSNYGNHITVVAPGANIKSLDNRTDNQIVEKTGTSMATPYVAGLVSLMKSLKPNLRIDQVFDVLRKSSVDMIGEAFEDTPGFDKYYGYGRIDVFSALQETLKIDNMNVTYSDFQCYPTICKPNGTINLLYLKNGETRLYFYTTTGMLVHKEKLEIDGVFTRIRIPDLADNVYLLRFHNLDTNETETKRLIIVNN